MLDLPTSAGADVAPSPIDGSVQFAPGDVTDTATVEAALDQAEERGPIRALVHCAGKGGTVRVVERDGSPGSLETYESLIRLNLTGTFNMLRLTAARMVRNDPVEDERGVCVLTRLGGGVGRSDRADPVCLRQGRHRRHDPGRRS